MRTELHRFATEIRTGIRKHLKTSWRIWVGRFAKTENYQRLNGNTKGDIGMAYYSSPKKYEDATGKRFTTKCSCIHVSGSVRGMVKLGFWDRSSDKVRHGNWIYQQPKK